MASIQMFSGSVTDQSLIVVLRALIACEYDWIWMAGIKYVKPCFWQLKMHQNAEIYCYYEYEPDKDCFMLGIKY